jgi:hypothetical protein
MVKPHRVRLGGVEVECVLYAGSLILRPVTFLPTTRVFVDPALGPPDEVSTESALRARAEMEIARMGDPLSKLGMWDEKLSKACNEIWNV